MSNFIRLKIADAMDLGEIKSWLKEYGWRIVGASAAVGSLIYLGFVRALFSSFLVLIF